MFLRRPRSFAALSVPTAIAVVIGAGVAIAAPRLAADRAPSSASSPISTEDSAREPVEAKLSVGCGTGQNTCAAEIYTVPERHRLEVRRVTCQFTVRAPGRIEDGAILFTRAADGAFGPVEAVRQSGSDDFSTYGFDATDRVTGKAGARLVVGVNSDNDVHDMTCALAGDLVAVL